MQNADGADAALELIVINACRIGQGAMEGGSRIWRKNYDVIALGELLVDFTMNGQSSQGNGMFEACPGAERPAMCWRF